MPLSIFEAKLAYCSIYSLHKLFVASIEERTAPDDLKRRVECRVRNTVILDDILTNPLQIAQEITSYTGIENACLIILRAGAFSN